ncbi:MAG: hypothetical protein ABR538_01545, partial [Candidatus Binatia bacterium]
MSTIPHRLALGARLGALVGPLLLAPALALAAPPANAASVGPVVIPMNLVDDAGGSKAVGTITATD